MGSQPSATPDPPATPPQDHPAGAQPGDAPLSPAIPAADSHPHDFEAQKRIHQQIRNDPDYDDWEYGTEPLPHEAWIAGRGGGAIESVPSATPQPVGEARSPGH